MDFTINCTRVPIPVGTLFEGVPVEIGPAPAITGLDSERDSNERSSLNPNGRGVLDSEDKRPKQLFHCKKQTIFSTLNTRTLTPKGRLDELAHCAKLNRIDIIAIQEHRFYHPKYKLQFQFAGDYLRISLDLSSDKGLEIKPRVSSRHPAEYVTDTDFADDISLIR